NNSDIAFYKIQSGNYISFAAINLEDGVLISVMPVQPALLPENKS
ncbi:MAG: hypothetical protein QG652_1555, partial [Pseudomonadota bacterium]|nr:hypothetical protein [Pseudomonadota bacterium]